MNCHYCNKECLRLNPDRHHWRCLPCKVEFDGPVIIIFGRFRNKGYLFRLLNGPYEFVAEIYKGMYGEYYGGEAIVKLRVMPDITPANINQKLATYLLFS